MAGRWDCGGMISDGSLMSGDHLSKVKEQKQQRLNKRGPSGGKGTQNISVVTSPPVKKGKTYHRQGSGRRSSNQRTMKIEADDLEFVEKDLLINDRKKSNNISLTHLLNFTITPRERNTVYNEYAHNKHTRRHSTYNKEQFLQANCQFVVHAFGDYSVHITQSDLLVQWDRIEQIRLLLHDIPSCPVCLYEPTAAKITRCGHIFCSSCILHYLALGERKWRKCPICYESVYKHDLKSVTTFACTQYKPNDMISMTLMKRKKGTTIVQPYANWDDSSVMDIPSYSDDQKCRFSKLVMASVDQVLSNIVEVEKTALQNQLASLTSDEDSERCFIEAALEDIRLRIESIRSLATQQQQHSMDADTRQHNVSNEVSDPDTSTCTTLSHEDSSHFTDHDRSSISSLELVSSASPSPKSDYVYFYQASDGQHLYLHPLNGKALVTEYGSWDRCPHTITARILEIDLYTMTEDEKIRSKYLNHLPLTCEFAFCELDIGPPLLSTETLFMFHDQFQKRKQRRQKKKREDKRLEKKQNKSTSAEIHLSSDPAEITPENFHDFLSLANSPPLPSPISSHMNPVEIPVPLCSKWPSSPSSEGLTSSPGSAGLSPRPSFAQALAQGDRKSITVVDKTVTGKTGLYEDLSTADDDFSDQSVPSFQNSFSDALLTCTRNVLVSTENKGGKPGGSKATKKGRKKIVLFSTAGGNHRV